MPNLDLLARLTAIQQSLVSLRACAAPDCHTQFDQLTEDLRAIAADVKTSLATQSPLRDNYEALFNNHHSVMLLIEPNSGQIVDANPAACAYYGYSHAELTTKRISDLNTLPPAEVQAEMQRAQQFKKNFFNFRHRLASGEIREVEVRSGTITLNDRPFLYSIIHDVTDRGRAEEALQRSEEKYRRLFNSAQVGIFRSSIAEGRILEANQKLAQMFGYDHPDDMRATFLSVSHYVNPADRIRLLTELKDDGTYVTFEIPFLRRNGTQLWALMEARKDVAAQCIEGVMLDITAHRLTADALIDSEVRNRSIIEALSEGILLQQSSGEIVFANASAAQILGLTREDLVGRASLDPRGRLIFPDGSPMPVDAHPGMVALRTGQPVRGVLAGVLKPDLTYAWLSVNAEPMFRANTPEPYAVVTSFVDVTDRVLADARLHQVNEELEQRVLERTAALQTSEANYRDLIENTVDWVWQIDQTGRYVYASPQVRDLLGYEPHAILGQTPLDLMSSDEAQRLAPLFANFVQQHQPFVGLENRARHRDGHEVVLETNGTPVIGEHGEFLGYRGTSRDITARKQAEDALCQSEERYRGLIESQADLIVRVDPTGKFTYVNDVYCATFGKTREELLGHSFTPLVHPDDLSATLKTMEGLSMPPYRVQIEQRAQAVNGWRWLSWEDYAIHDEHGTIIEIQAMGSDITERKQAEMRLRALLDAIPDMMFLNSADGIYLDYHAPRAAALAAPPEVFLGKHMREVLPPDLCTEFEAAITQVLQQGISITHEYTLVIQDQPHQFEARLVKCGTDEVLTVVRDVTERKRSEEALHQSAENYRNLFENASVGIFHSLPEGRFLRVNSTLAHMLGYASPDEMVATITDIGAQLYLDTDKRMNLLNTTLQRKGWVYAENRYRRKDGSILIGTLAVRQVRKPDGSLAYLEGFLEDITERRHAEDALRESETLYHTLVETLPMNIFRKDRAGHFTFVNSLFSHTEGRSPAEILGKTDLDLHPAELAQKYRDDDESVMLSGNQLNLVEVHQSLDGPPIYVQTIKTPLYDAAGNLIGIQGVFWDISQLQRAEVALRESETRYRALFEAADDAIFVSRVHDGISDETIAVNDVACTRLGYTREELLTAPISQYDSMEHMEQLGPVSKQLRTAGRATFERVHVARNGRRIPVEISARQFELNGEEVVLSIVRDITERKWAEAALRESEVRYRTLFEAANDAIFIHQVRPDGFPGDILAVNNVACEWLGYTREELLHTSVELYDTMDHLDEAVRAIDQLHTVGYATFERLCVTRDGGRFPVEINARRLELNGEQVYLSIMRDITQRKQAETALKQALERERELNQLKTQFVSMVSHEFRTPLTAIQSTSDLLMHYSQRFSEQKKSGYLERIQAAVKRMTTMLDEVLVLGRAESGKLDFNPAPIDLEWFCRTLADEFQLSAGEAYNLNFEFKNGCQEPNLDESLLRHILTNLLSNAIKYSPTGGMIDFSVTCDGGQVAFRVADHGIGIPPEGQTRLFETFYRANNVGSIQGTGLGLSIVKRAVDLHHGTIMFDSVPDCGTTFVVKLPLVQA